MVYEKKEIYSLIRERVFNIIEILDKYKTKCILKVKGNYGI